MKRAMVGSAAAMALVAAPAQPVYAGQISATRAQIGALEARINSQAGSIHAFTQAYDNASLQVSTLKSQVRVDTSQLVRVRATLSRERATLIKQALASYTGAAPTVGVLPALKGDQSPAVRAEYLRLATGDVANAMGRYQLEQRLLDTTTRSLQKEQAAAVYEVDKAAAARQGALAEAASTQTLLDTLQGRLNRLVSEAAAKAAAQRAAAYHAAVVAKQSSTTQGMPVGGGLLSTVRSLVSPSSPTSGVSTKRLAIASNAGASGTGSRLAVSTSGGGSNAISAPQSTSARRSDPPSTSAPSTTSSAPSTTSSPPSTSAPSTTSPTSTTAPSGSASPSASVWLELRNCESGDNYQANTGNGFYGAYQFTQSTWTALGYPGRPDQAPPAMQNQAAVKLQAQSGWGQWPACSAALGL